MTRARAVATDDDVDDVRAVLRELVDEVRALRTAVERLEQRPDSSRVPREDAAVAIVKRAVELGLRRFSSQELFALQSTDATLRQALAAAWIDSSTQLGKGLWRLYRRGLVDRDATRGSHGWVWRP